MCVFNAVNDAFLGSVLLQPSASKGFEAKQYIVSGAICWVFTFRKGFAIELKENGSIPLSINLFFEKGFEAHFLRKFELIILPWGRFIRTCCFRVLSKIWSNPTQNTRRADYEEIRTEVPLISALLLPPEMESDRRTTSLQL